MELIIIYILFFLMGTVFGSFFTLAVYRIPLNQDITHKRSYCPNCNHKLSFLDMIPIFSYIFLGGKCRYCKQKIRIRYLILEILTGIVFLFFAMSLNIKSFIIDFDKIMYLIFGILYICGIIIIAGIDKEKYQINKYLIIYETLVVCTYIIYLYTVGIGTNIYRYVIYLCLLSLFLITENIYLKKNLKSNYTLQILELSMIMGIFTQSENFFITVIITLLIIAFKQTIKKIFNNKEKICSNTNKLPIGYYLCISNILVMIIINWLIYRR